MMYSDESSLFHFFPISCFFHLFQSTTTTIIHSRQIHSRQQEEVVERPISEWRRKLSSSLEESCLQNKSEWKTGNRFQFYCILSHNSNPGQATSLPEIVLVSPTSDYATHSSLSPNTTSYSYTFLTESTKNIPNFINNSLPLFLSFLSLSFINSKTMPFHSPVTTCYQQLS